MQSTENDFLTDCSLLNLMLTNVYRNIKDFVRLSYITEMLKRRPTVLCLHLRNQWPIFRHVCVTLSLIINVLIFLLRLCIWWSYRITATVLRLRAYAFSFSIMVNGCTVYYLSISFVASLFGRLFCTRNWNIKKVDILTCLHAARDSRSDLWPPSTKSVLTHLHLLYGADSCYTVLHWGRWLGPMRSD